jgi:hypothetical protein
MEGIEGKNPIEVDTEKYLCESMGLTLIVLMWRIG